VLRPLILLSAREARRPADREDAAAAAQCDRQVEKIPPDAVHEGGAVRARHVEDRPVKTPAERHAEERRHDHDADPQAGLAGREVLAD
jgi:hypothetical protein